MKRNFARFTKTGFFILLSISLFSCSGKKINENDPGELYGAAEDDIKDERFLQALDRLRIIQNKFPYSSYAVTASLRKADVYFTQESYAEAAVAYDAFCDLHPRHEKVAYARFRAAESYDKDVPGNIARDLASAQKAIQAYQKFLTLHGSHESAPLARSRIHELNGKLADKELQIANFYRRWDAPDSARGRYEGILKDFPDTEAAGEAKEKLAKLPPPETEDAPK